MAEVTMLRKNNIGEKIDFLKKIQQNRTKEQEVLQELKKENGQTQEDNEIVYINGRIYIFNNKEI